MYVILYGCRKSGFGVRNALVNAAHDPNVPARLGFERTDWDKPPGGGSGAIGAAQSAPIPRSRASAERHKSLSFESCRLSHPISFLDETAPQKKAKPKGVIGPEMWVKIGDPRPADPGELSFLALDTSSPYLAEYTGPQAGKTAPMLIPLTPVTVLAAFGHGTSQLGRLSNS